MRHLQAERTTPPEVVEGRTGEATGTQLSRLHVPVIIMTRLTRFRGRFLRTAPPMQCMYHHGNSFAEQPLRVQRNHTQDPSSLM